jgi:threonine synthase
MSQMFLVCSGCGQRTEANSAVWRCPDCASPLEFPERAAFDAENIDQSAIGLWRYRHALPFALPHQVSMSEPTTPLIPVEIGGAPVLAKYDGLLPTGSFKDRGMAVLVSWLVERGISHVVEDSSGNAAASIAGYAARAGIGCTVYAPAAASPGKLVQAAAFGADVRLIPGSRDDVAHAAEQAALVPGAAYATHNWHPIFVEGVKTWAFEIWEQLGHQVPDAIVAPAGSGSLILGAWHAFRQIGTMPRIYAAQAQACAPLARAFEQGAEATQPFERTPSRAEGIMIANPVRNRELLSALRSSGGGAISIAEEQIAVALRAAAHQGIYVEPTSAVAWAATQELINAGSIAPGERVVTLLSGNGLKATQAISEMLA